LKDCEIGVIWGGRDDSLVGGEDSRFVGFSFGWKLQVSRKMRLDKTQLDFLSNLAIKAVIPHSLDNHRRIFIQAKETSIVNILFKDIFQAVQSQ
jgi:hypothetical protein